MADWQNSYFMKVADDLLTDRINQKKQREADDRAIAAQQAIDAANLDMTNPAYEQQAWQAAHDAGALSTDYQNQQKLANQAYQLKQARDNMYLNLYKKALAGQQLGDADIALAQLAGNDQQVAAMLGNRFPSTAQDWSNKNQIAAQEQAHKWRQQDAADAYAYQQAARQEQWKHDAELRAQAQQEAQKQRETMFKDLVDKGINPQDAIAMAYGGRLDSKSGTLSSGKAPTQGKQQNRQSKGTEISAAQAKAIQGIVNLTKQADSLVARRFTNPNDTNGERKRMNEEEGNAVDAAYQALQKAYENGAIDDNIYGQLYTRIEAVMNDRQHKYGYK